MEENKNPRPEDQLTYEQLTTLCNQLGERCRVMQAQLQELQTLVTSKRLDYVFKVLELRELFSSDFIHTCVKEIEESLTITEQA